MDFSKLGIAMHRVIYFVLFYFFTFLSFADDVECTKLDARVGGSEDNYRPPLEATVIGKDRLYFYSAPNERCKMKDVFVIAGDMLTVYKPFDGWVNVMYISKDGNDFMGWVDEKRIKKIGQYGLNP